jgi:hypothetical protein
MQRLTPIRPVLSTQPSGVAMRCVSATLFLACTIAAAAQTTQQQHALQHQQMQHQFQQHQQEPHTQSPAPIVEQQSPAHVQGIQPQRGPLQRGQQHIGPWLQSHQNMSPEEQQRALAQEPGFNSLPPAQQQRMQQRLSQLNSMPPEERQRTVDRIEAMERLSPDQRQQIRGAMAGLGSLPPDRRRAVAKSFHDLRMMPPNERQQVMNSPQFRAQFSDQERGTLTNLMTVEPYLPPPAH